MSGVLERFAAEVGAEGAVVPVGGRTQWHVGGDPAPGARPVRAPAGIVSHQPAEMTVRVRAGTLVADLDAALAAAGQMVPLDPPDPARATVGGVLAVGHSGLRRLRYGPVRDTLLEVRFVNAAGALVRAGGPVVKNVSGYDLCRLLVGSLGTLGVLAEVVLRVHPRPARSAWWRGPVDPFALRSAVHRPSALLWDGAETWLLLEGAPAEVDAVAAGLPPALQPAAGPPPLPPHRRSLRPAEMRSLAPAGTFLAEIGVGTVHSHVPADPAPVDRPDLHDRIRRAFDPGGRLNPGRRPW